MSEWISVEERLPVHYQTVIVTDGEKSALGSMNRVTGLRVCHVRYQDPLQDKITHWMLLPEPPQ